MVDSRRDRKNKNRGGCGQNLKALLYSTDGKEKEVKSDWKQNRRK